MATRLDNAAIEGTKSTNLPLQITPIKEDENKEPICDVTFNISQTIIWAETALKVTMLVTKYSFQLKFP